METDYEEGLGVSSWLTTFSDLIFLLLSFFVLKMAMQPSSSETLARHNQQSLSTAHSAEQSSLKTQTERQSEYRIELAENDFRRSIEAKLAGRFTPQKNGADFGNELSVRRSPRGRIITIQSPFLEADPSDLTFRTSEFLRSIAAVARERELSIEVRAIIIGSDPPELLHGPNPPVISPTLSSGRRLTIAAIRQIVDTGLPSSRISATGTVLHSTDGKTRYSLELTLARPEKLIETPAENTEVEEK